MSVSAIESMLRSARDEGLLTSLEIQFASRLAALYEESSPEVVWAVALACRHEAQGHVCVDLNRIADEGLVVSEPRAPGTEGSGKGSRPALPEGLTLKQWFSVLRKSPLIGEATGEVARPGEGAAGSFGDALSESPLLLDASGRLYLQRSFADQFELATLILDRVRRDAPDTRGGGEAGRGEEGESSAERSWVDAALARLAPADPKSRDASSTRAAHDALRNGMRRALTIVTGGPGTGKTTLMARLVALIVEAQIEQGRGAPRIRLLAPTGKAAAAMSNSFQRQRDALDTTEAVKSALPAHAETIHRVVLRQSRTDALGQQVCRPLRDDLIVVDEASMVDLSLMRQLFEMGRDADRILLLGDPDQLASVDSGAVLGELCAAASQGKRAAGTATLANSWVELTTSHRFAAGGAIGRLAEAIRDGDADQVMTLLEDPEIPEVMRAPADSVPNVQANLIESARLLQEAILSSDAPGEKLDRLSTHRILCAHRVGPLGVEALCERLDEAGARLRKTSSRGGWWPGRLLLVTRNAPEQDLWNGDVGLVEETRAGLRALFPSAEGPVRSLSAGRLPAFESAIAMSIHKSQGSEFDSVDLVLGNVPSRLMTRELLYTGVTRARERVVVHASEEVVRAAVEARVVRDSGLVDLLTKNAPRGSES